ncbi:TPA: glycosyltransferase family 1 protein [Candidatus Poribacteria bacterium]|nr:glycosyltransferase family 1 protein [Candidatus Poribacteria bacterium]
MQMKKIRLLQCITLSTFGGKQIGGASIALLRLLKGLNLGRFETSLAVGNEGLLTEEAIKLGVKVYLIPELKQTVTQGTYILSDVLATIKIYRTIINTKCDIIHTHSSKMGFLARLAAKLAGVPVVIHTVQGFPFYREGHWMVKKLYLLLERLAGKWTDMLICVSRKDYDNAVANLITSANRAVVIHNGVELTKFNPDRTSDLRNEFGFAPNTPVIGMIARLDPQKNPQTFVRAGAIVLKSIEEAKFICVGDGVFYPEIKQMVDELNISKSFILTGWRQDVPELLSTLDIFVIPSIWEGFPLSILEAMAMGKPVISSDIPGSRELVMHNQTGLLAPPKNPELLANAIIELIQDKDKAKRLANNGQQLVKNAFDMNKIVKQHEAVYKRLYQGICAKKGKE